jgi:two-component system, NtrC family, nitrogen regulation sensor histidine kinase NtrY
MWWSVAAAVALVSAARWLSVPSLPYLIACGGATAAALLLAVRPWGAGTWRARTAAVAMLAFVAVATVGERQLYRIQWQWPSMSASTVADSRADMLRELGRLAAALHDGARAALDAPADLPGAFAAVGRAERVARGGQSAARSERAVVLYRDGRPAAWAGTVRAAPTEEAAPYQITRTAFYIALQVTVTASDGSRAVAVGLLHAEPPADRMSAPLDAIVAARTGVAGFTLDDPAGRRRRDDVFSVREPGVAGENALLAVEPLPPQEVAAQDAATDRARRSGAIAFVIALLTFVAAEWSARAALSRRLFALAVPLATIAIVPLNDFSNVSPVFNPSYFYSRLGGRFTSCVAAFGLTAAIAALGALAAARAHARIRPRAIAALIALVACAGAPYVLWRLADGITPPSSGIPLELWIVWQLTIALAGVAIFVVAGIAARSAMRRGPRVAPGWAIALTAIVALVGPELWMPPGTWPAWYAPLWMLAALVTVCVRDPRWRVLAITTTAGLGAALLIWATSAQKRIGLAERDVSGLRQPDPAAEQFLEQFGAELAGAPPARTRADLLTRYARSELASAGYPVSLTAWAPVNGLGLSPAATLMMARFTIPDQRVRDAVAAAGTTGAEMLDSAQGSPGVQLFLAVPDTTNAVTSVVVAPLTRLITDEPFAPLFGIPADASSLPAYTMSLIGLASGRSAPIISDHWTREENELHADWVVAGLHGPARAHAEIDLRSLDTLAERGTLLLLLDLFVVFGALWMVAAAAGGGFGRWLRTRARQWARSYRAQLTLVLFVFFVAPVLLFAAWSYRRLASDDAQSRALLVWETLRSVVNNDEFDDLSGAGERLDTPLLLYHDGALTATSDTLLAELAPTGYFLRPAVQLGLGVGGEVTAKQLQPLAGTATLFGYRAATDIRGEHVVLAAPARSNDVELDLRRSDLSMLLMFATAAGAVAALWLSGLAARQFARPIDALRRAALAAAAGEREPDLGGAPPAEFEPVFSAFRRMAADFGASQRVLAWGEMARQVAHEIKNPLTPMRLGVQHLLRARADGRPDFDRILQQNVSRILAEIDRLDQIARAFSRYGTAPEERPPGEPTDVASVVRDVVDLERMGADSPRGGVVWSVVGVDEDHPPLMARARSEELREVLLNVLENARLANARRVDVRASREPGRVVIAVQDDGDGIPEDVMPRIFEPRFSTRTSGSGLGLAISRRLVDGWGGSINVTSARASNGGRLGGGTLVTIGLVAT